MWKTASGLESQRQVLGFRVRLYQVHSAVKLLDSLEVK